MVSKWPLQWLHRHQRLTALTLRTCHNTHTAQNVDIVSIVFVGQYDDTTAM